MSQFCCATTKKNSQCSFKVNTKVNKLYCTLHFNLSQNTNRDVSNKDIVKDVSNKDVSKMHNKIIGLYYISDIGNILNAKAELDKETWIPLSNASNSRLVQHYGYKYNYSTSKITEKGQDFPDVITMFKNILTKNCLELGIIDSKYVFNQCIVNKYLQNQGISQHIDVLAYGEVIGCFTIGHGASMTFTKDFEKEEVHVEENSLYIMSDESRYKWKHGMCVRKYDNVDGIKIERGERISITFRMVPGV